jgi:hypothetical protein
MKRFILFIAFFATAGVVSAQTAAAPQTISAAEEARMIFASKATQLDVAIQRNVPQAYTEIMNGVMADMQSQIARASRQMNGISDPVAKAEMGKRIAGQSDIYAAIKTMSVNIPTNRAAINSKLREFVKLM